MPDLSTRPITADERAAYHRVCATGFGHHVNDEETALEDSLLDLDRTVGAFAGEELVATAASYPFALTVPGGGLVDVAGVTAVAVLPTHRRRGALRAMMTHQLDDVAARGEPLAVLNASEGGIYRRFGYGVATRFRTVRTQRHRAALLGAPVERDLRLVSRQDAVDALPAIYEAARLAVPGSLSRTAAWWRVVLGEHKNWKGGGPLFVVVAEPTADDPGGYAIYTLEHLGPGVAKRLEVWELVAAGDDTAAALWQYCTRVDLVATAEVTVAPLDDPLAVRLVDPRAYEVAAELDYLWVRLLDVAAACEARAYGVDDVLTLEVSDAFRPATAGTFRLTVVDGAARCERVEGPADVRLDVAELGSLYLGGGDAGQLARAGLVEGRPEVVARLDRLFRGDRQPHCTTRF